MKKLALFFIVLMAAVSAMPSFAARRNIMELPLFERAVLIIKSLKRYISLATGPTSDMVTVFCRENLIAGAFS